MASITPTELGTELGTEFGPEFGIFPREDAAPAGADATKEQDQPHWLRYLAIGAIGVTGAVLVANPVTRRFAVNAAKAYGARRLVDIARDALKRG